MPVPTFGEAKFPAWVSVTVSPDTTPLKLPSASAAVVVPSYTLPLTAVPSTVSGACAMLTLAKLGWVST